MAKRSKPHHLVAFEAPVAESQPSIDIDAVVPGREARLP
jgi:hypothetical protein